MNKGLFLDDGDAMRALLELMQTERQVLIRLDKRGHVVSQTEQAEKLLGLTTLHPIGQVLSENASRALMAALENGTGLRAEETIDHAVYTLELRPLQDGGLLCMRPFERQRTHTELEERLLRDTENTLASILLTAAYCRTAGEERRAEMIEKIQRACRRIQRSIEHVRLLEEPALPERLRLEAGDLAELCRTVAARCAARCPNIVIKVEAPERQEAVFDREMLSIALVNLLVNALCAKDVHEVELSLTAAGGRLLLTVRDDGQGIAPDDAGRLIDGWEQPADLSVEALMRTRPGMGLPLAHRIAAQHGGVLLIETTQAGGCVRLSLPADLEPDLLSLHAPLMPESGFDRIELELSVLP